MTAVSYLADFSGTPDDTTNEGCGLLPGTRWDPNPATIGDFHMATDIPCQEF